MSDNSIPLASSLYQPKPTPIDSRSRPQSPTSHETEILDLKLALAEEKLAHAATLKELNIVLTKLSIAEENVAKQFLDQIDYEREQVTKWKQLLAEERIFGVAVANELKEQAGRLKIVEMEQELGLTRRKQAEKEYQEQVAMARDSEAYLEERRLMRVTLKKALENEQEKHFARQKEVEQFYERQVARAKGIEKLLAEQLQERLPCEAVFDTALMKKYLDAFAREETAEESDLARGAAIAKNIPTEEGQQHKQEKL